MYLPLPSTPPFLFLHPFLSFPLSPFLPLSPAIFTVLLIPPPSLAHPTSSIKTLSVHFKLTSFFIDQQEVLYISCVTFDITVSLLAHIRTVHNVM